MTRLKRKVLITAIILLGILIIATPIVNFYLVKRIDKSYANIIDSKITSLRLLQSIIRMSTNRQKNVADILLMADSSDVQQLSKENFSLSKRNDVNFSEIAKWYAESPQRKMFEKVKEVRLNYNTSLLTVFKLLNENKKEESIRYNKEVILPLYNNYQELLDTLVMNNHIEAFQLNSSTSEQSESLRKAMFGLGIVPSIILLIPMIIAIIILLTTGQYSPVIRE